MKSLGARLSPLLGVATAYYGLAHHGGDVTVEGTLGVGTTLVPSLPIAQQESVGLEASEDRRVGSISSLG